MFVLDLFHWWNGSEVEFMEVDRKDPWERHSFLILLAPLINECCPLGLTLKRRLHTWFQFAPNSIVWECNFFSIYKTISRFWRVLVLFNTQDTAWYWLLALSTNLAENFDSCLRLVFIFLCSLFVSLMKYYDDYLSTDIMSIEWLTQKSWYSVYGIKLLTGQRQGIDRSPYTVIFKCVELHCKLIWSTDSRAVNCEYFNEAFYFVRQFFTTNLPLFI